MSFTELPKHWKRIKLGEAAKFIDYRGRTPKKTESGIPLITAKNVKMGFINVAPREFIAEEDYERWMTRGIPNKGDVLFTTEAPLGNVAQIKTSERIALAQRIITFQPFAHLNNSFLKFSLLSPQFQQSLKARATGTTVDGIKAAILKQLEIPLPPLTEQQRIVAKLEELFSELDAGLASLKTAAQQLKTYRQAVLKWAFEGKLTNDHVNEGELPAGWKWVALSGICKIIGGVTKGRDFKGKETIFLPYLRVANVQDGYLDLKEIKTIEVLPSDKDKYKLEFGDILYTEGGDKDKLGRGTIWKNEITDCIHQNHIFRARPITKEIDSKYIAYFSRTTTAKNYFFKHGKQTTNLASINLTILSNLPIPLCSLEEQHRIVQEIESRLSVCDKLEETLAASLRQAEALRQSILKQAFEGKLLRQETEIQKPNNLPFYQMRLLGLIIYLSHKHKIRHGEMTIAKYAYLLDRIYGVRTYFNFRRGNLGPYSGEIKKTIHNPTYFKVESSGIQLQKAEQLLKYPLPYQSQIEAAVTELAEIFLNYGERERPHKTELLATVCKVIEDVQSLDLQAIRQSMAGWEIDLPTTNHKNKAQKFTEEETANCLAFIVRKGWDKKLLKTEDK